MRPDQVQTLRPIDRGHAGEDGSYIGTGYGNLIALGLDGSLLWQQMVGTAPITPLYATADGGAIVTSTTQCPRNVVANLQDLGASPLCSPALGTLYTVDQNGNVTGQTPDTGAAYSWTGMLYASSQTISAVPGLVSVDPAASYWAFGGGGNPSQTDAAVRLVQVKIFVPVQMGPSAAYDQSWVNQVKQYVGIRNAALDFRMYSNPRNLPTESSFIASLNTTNSIVAYLDHAIISGTDLKTAIGLEFTDASLYSQELSGLSPSSASSLSDIRESVTPNSRVIFLAICGFTDPFKSFWNMNRTGHALIYPTYLPANTNLNIDLGYAIWDFEEFLYQMGQGHSVGQALTTAISSAQAQQEQIQWACQGDQDFHFLPANQAVDNTSVTSTPCGP